MARSTRYTVDKGGNDLRDVVEGLSLTVLSNLTCYFKVEVAGLEMVVDILPRLIVSLTCMEVQYLTF